MSRLIITSELTVSENKQVDVMHLKNFDPFYFGFARFTPGMTHTPSASPKLNSGYFEHKM